MKHKVTAALKIAGQILLVGLAFYMIYAFLWLGYYAGFKM